MRQIKNLFLWTTLPVFFSSFFVLTTVGDSSTKLSSCVLPLLNDGLTAFSSVNWTEET